MTPAAYINAARCPPTIPTGDFGLWKIERQDHSADPVMARLIGCDLQTILSRWTPATMHLGRGDIVMEDSNQELARHLPIWMHGRGRILVTGLGLGCVVRALRINPEVESVTVVEIDRKIIDLIWPEFAGDPRLTIPARRRAGCRMGP